tara:strand:- start:81 stop:392 length:312 start_codon:yes stop_codon:yes gene_type:complete
MELTGQQAHEKLKNVEAELYDIVDTLLGQSVSVCDDEHPSFAQVGHICNVNVTITSFHLQVNLDKEMAESIDKVAEVGEETKNHPWFKLDEIEIIGAESAPIH